MLKNLIPFETKERKRLEPGVQYIFETFLVPLVSQGYRIANEIDPNVVVARFQDYYGRNFDFTRHQVGAMAKRQLLLPESNGKFLQLKE